MKRLMVVTMMASAGVAGLAADAWACSPPPRVEQVMAVVPEPDAVGVSTASPIVLQLQSLEAFDFNTPRAFPGGFEISVETADGVPLVTQMREDAYASEAGWDVVTIDPGELAPETTYVVRLASPHAPDNQIEWSFTTGAGTLEPVAVEPLAVTIGAGWANRNVYHCCELDGVGSCPDCYKIGTDPVGQVSAAFERLDHELGDGAYVYTLQRRRADGTAWEDALTGVGTFSLDEVAEPMLSFESSNLAVHDECFRVVARSAVDATLVVEGTETCIAPDAFGTRPEAVRDDTGQCDVSDPDPQDPDPDDPQPDDPQPDDPQPGDPEGDVPGEDTSHGADDDVSGDDTTSAGGCSMAHSAPRPGSVALVVMSLFGAAMFGRRRRH